MESVFFAANVLYAAYVMALIWSWHRCLAKSRRADSAAPSAAISIVVVIRNEAEHIGALIETLARQRGVHAPYEIIIVDDGSDDGSAEIVQAAQKKVPNLKLLHRAEAEDGVETPKKAGITQALQQAAGELILVTDGDCMPGPGWVAGMVAPFVDPKTYFASGPVKYQTTGGWWQRWQALEFSSLVGAGGAMIGLGYPVMCNGANMAFRKRAFFAVGGYADTRALASGDDVFLMMRIHRSFGGIRFVRDRNAIVMTSPAPTWRAFSGQRIRWAAKWLHYPLWYARLLPPLLFAYNLTFIAALAALFAGYMNAVLFGVLCVVKIVVEYVFLRGMYRFQESDSTPERWWFVALSALIYPFYAVSFGILASVGGYEWKGRKYRK
jgi:cellulose synthase/poly-beta-1,6-N-acetylglucosamine synthase-like glycosyltransferase